MPLELQTLCHEIRPDRTVLMLGAGAGVPSGAPTAADLARLIATKFGVPYDETLTLAEIATLAEARTRRREIMELIRTTIRNLSPTGGLLNIPLFDWKDIFTTNYDLLVERAYELARKPLSVVASNFDFEQEGRASPTHLFKLHGTVDQDRSFGHTTSMILTEQDYELTKDYRELVLDRFLHETSSHDVLIVGNSLADRDLNAILSEAARRKRTSGAPGKLYALVYNRDNNRAALIQQRGFEVCFAGIDDLIDGLHHASPATVSALQDTGDLLSNTPQLRPSTIDVDHSVQHGHPDVVQLYSGAPATYADIVAGLTFRRDLLASLEDQLVADDAKPVAYVLGPAGFGKTTLCRQVLTGLSRRMITCWEHKGEHRLDSRAWCDVANACRDRNVKVALLVDDAHAHMRAVDVIVDHLAATQNRCFKLLLVSTPAHWRVRTKTPSVFRVGTPYAIGRLSHAEVHSLLELYERKPEIANLAQAAFAGFSRQERLRRLMERCRSDMFVCLKNMFSVDALDDIILKDYGSIDQNLQDVYRTVAAMEASNIRVHRQLVMRTLGLEATAIAAVLDQLTGIVSEYEIDARNGIYGWRGRHQVISEIILRYKYHGQEELFTLYERVIDNINPSYDVEQMTLSELCGGDTGVGRIHDRQRQNYLYRKMVSVAPSQRPPRHRLIGNLIREGEFDAAANEIRMFEKELRKDAPIVRYKAKLFLERARGVAGLLREDRIAILGDGILVAQRGLEVYPADRGLHEVHCELGLEAVRQGGKWTAYDGAMARLSAAAEEYLDPELARLIARVRQKADRLMCAEA